ncbi:MAG TPA: hypothetical protein VEA40_00185 [Ramlibacter sp.]|nr:hypothetical protein [Ramlibacter sp.]
MPSRLLHRLQTPRDRVLALLLSALAALQLLAFYQLCLDQVQNAQARRQSAVVQRQATGDCPQPIAPSLAKPCTADAGADAARTASATLR